MSASPATVAGPAPSGPARPALTPLVLWELLVGLRDAYQRRAMLDSAIPVYQLDADLRRAEILSTSGQVNGSTAHLVILVRLPAGNVRAATFTIRPESRTPVVHAAVL